MVVCHVIGEAVTEIQPCRMHAFAPIFIGLRNSPRRGRRHAHDFNGGPKLLLPPNRKLTPFAFEVIGPRATASIGR